MTQTLTGSSCTGSPGNVGSRYLLHRDASRQQWISWNCVGLKEQDSDMSSRENIYWLRLMHLQTVQIKCVLELLSDFLNCVNHCN